MEYRLLWADGSVHWVEGRGRLYTDESGKPVRMIGICQDISQRKRLEQELRIRVDELAEADRRKDEFLAMLAHELRNPLAPIRNALHIIAIVGGEKPPEVRRAWQMIERHVEHMVRLVDDLLDISRITRGKINLQKEVVDLASVVNHALEGSRPLIESRRHRLEVSVAAGPLLVRADATRMAQVILNLLNNAAKYTPEGGRIWLTLQKEQDQAVVRVRDTGVGMPPELLPKVFDLFAQGDRTLDRSEGGLGIGLTLVRRLLEMHDGSVEAFSEGPGRGSEFVVRLPLLQEPQPVPTPGKVNDVKAPRAARRHRILVVDDNRDSAESFAVLLRLTGNEVVTAHEGARALELAASYHPDVVFLDIGLPGMNGYEIARLLRPAPGQGPATLIAMTGFGTEEARREAEAAGFDHHMVKPVQLAEVQSILKCIKQPSAP
jgi:two-component system CheB/CheR fusion protein